MAGGVQRAAGKRRLSADASLTYWKKKKNLLQFDGILPGIYFKLKRLNGMCLS
jgi:hypothetical protein